MTDTTAPGTPNADQINKFISSNSADDDIQLVYVADPMCSWCYGFSPIIKSLAAQFDGRMAVWPLMGGLRAGNTQPMTQADKDYIREAWGNVATASAQPFNHDFFDRDGFVYDTEPACRAVVTMRYMHTDRTLEFISAISTAFYAQGRDTTKADVLIDIAEEFGADRERFERGLNMPEIAEATAHDFSTARSLGVQTFPTLLAGTDDTGYATLHNGYSALENLSRPIEDWFKAQAT